MLRPYYNMLRPPDNILRPPYNILYHTILRPYNISKITFTVLGADGNEIKTR